MTTPDPAQAGIYGVLMLAAGAALPRLWSFFLARTERRDEREGIITQTQMTDRDRLLADLKRIQDERDRELSAYRTQQKIEMERLQREVGDLRFDLAAADAERSIMRAELMQSRQECAKLTDEIEALRRRMTASEGRAQT